jgi:hypothetical protein
MMIKDRNRRPTFIEVAHQLARIADRLGGELPRVTRQLFLVNSDGTPGGSSISSTTSTSRSNGGTGDKPSNPRTWRRALAFGVILATAVGLAIAFGR